MTDSSVPLPENAFDAAKRVGRPDINGPDTARFLVKPDIYFLRPWISTPGGSAFIWPLGVEGFDLTIDPTLGIHRYIGDNNVEIDVVHRGSEVITLSGVLPGIHSPKMMQQLRDVVYQVTPDDGKILYLPGILPMPQRGAVSNVRFGHAEGEMFRDLTYSFAFQRSGTVASRTDPPAVKSQVPNGGSGGKSRGSASNVLTTTSTLNTLRKLAQAKLGNADQWAGIYNNNRAYFDSKNLPSYAVPDYAIPPGTSFYA